MVDGPFFTGEFNFFGCGALGLGRPCSVVIVSDPYLRHYESELVGCGCQCHMGGTMHRFRQPNNHSELTQRC